MFEGEGEGVRVWLFSGTAASVTAGPALEICVELVLGVSPFEVCEFNRFSSSVMREIRLEVLQVE